MSSDVPRARKVSPVGVVAGVAVAVGLAVAVAVGVLGDGAGGDVAPDGPARFDVQPVREGCAEGSEERLASVVEADLIVAGSVRDDPLGAVGTFVVDVTEVRLDERPPGLPKRAAGDGIRVTGQLSVGPERQLVVFLGPAADGDWPRALMSLVDGQPYDEAGCALLTDRATAAALDRLVAAHAALEAGGQPVAPAPEVDGRTPEGAAARAEAMTDWVAEHRELAGEPEGPPGVLGSAFEG